jgi:hypothetical protein
VSYSPEIGQWRKLRVRCLLVFAERRSATTKHGQYKAEFKAGVALEAEKGEQTVAELGSGPINGIPTGSEI